MRHLSCFILVLAPLGLAQEHTSTGSLVANGSFEKDADGNAAPDGWTTSGTRDINQSLTLDDGRAGGKSAKLTCTQFVPGSPASHAMVCQLNTVGLKRGQWYRIAFWVKAEGLPRPMANVAVSNTKTWSDTGVRAYFPVTASWQRIERMAQAKADVPAEHTRLQIWFASTGLLWLDDVEVTPIQMRVEFHPQISTAGVRNIVPNSSFECGAAGWGSYSPSVRSWTGNVFRQLGEIDDSTAAHGQRSLRMALAKGKAPVFYFDYFTPIETELRSLVAGHQGWVPVAPGKPYALSCWLKADGPDVPARLMVFEAPWRQWKEVVSVGTEWQRFSFTFKPRGSFVWTGVGLDLESSPLDDATIWVDAVQLEAGAEASDFAARQELETFIETPAVGNVFTDPAQGLSVEVVAWNGSDESRGLRGTVTVTDFADQEVLTRTVQREVGPSTQVRVRVAALLKGRRGFFRVHWRPADGSSPFPQTLRCALIEPYEHRDSAFGMNHAYPWAFLLRLAKTAGLTWMRDWSVKWHTVEPERGRFDFSAPDAQINRVVRANLNPLVLFPFASTPWCSTADMKLVKEAAAGNKSREERYVVAWLAENEADFRNYVARSVEHYRDRVRYYEIMNEPLYTTYSVPAKFGYQMSDYIGLLKASYETIKAHQSDARVVGGIGTWIGRHWVHDFIAAGGLRWTDIMDIHLYAPTIPPELHEQELAPAWQTMVDRGEAKPIWLTEFGCYADDDPYKTPGQIGDSAMSRSNWPSERAAAEALVKTSAVFFTYGIRKIFFHAGTCGSINRSTGGGIFFEYGGAPRKMYAAVAALASMLGPELEPIRPPVATDQVRAYFFRTARGSMAVAWASDGKERHCPLPTDVTARDLMGNVLAGGQLVVAGTPTYVQCSRTDRIRALLESVR